MLLLVDMLLLRALGAEALEGDVVISVDVGRKQIKSVRKIHELRIEAPAIGFCHKARCLSSDRLSQA